MTPAQTTGDPRLSSQAAGFLSALLASRLLQAAYFFIVMHALGAADRGRYHLTLALASLASTWMNLGYDAAVVRAVAAGTSRGGGALRGALASKGILGAVVLAAASAAGFVVWGEDPKAALLALFCASVYLEALLASGFAFFQGTGRFREVNVLNLAGSALTLAAGALVAWRGFGILGFAWAVLAVQAVRLAVAMRWLSPSLREEPEVPTAEEARRLRRAALEIGLLDLLGLLFMWEDTVLVGLLSGDAALGSYGPARALVGNAALIPLAVRTVVYPAFVRAAEEGGDALAALYRRSAQGLLAAAVPIAALVSFLAPQCAVLLVGSDDAERLVPALRILPWTLPFSFLQSPCGFALFARHEERRLLAPQAALVAAFAAALLWGSRQGPSAFPWIVVAATATNYLLFLPWVARIGRLDLAGTLWRPLAAGALAAVAFLLPAPWWLRGAAFLGAYAGLLLALGVIERRHAVSMLTAGLAREEPSPEDRA